jgi:RimJ/RimL family protein N-acetyltransferase
MIKLVPFAPSDFDEFISWIDSEELLVTIAGTALSFPLTREQLQKYLELENSHSFTVFDAGQNIKVGHAEIVLSAPDTYKIDKLTIGNKANRGKGIGEKVITELLNFSFGNLNASIVELNVFDWNVAGIRCYEKCGFIMNESKRAEFKVGDKSWTALNMIISMEDWSKRQGSKKTQIDILGK